MLGHDNQARLTSSAELSLTPAEYAEYFTHMRQTARERGIDRILDDYNVDVIIGLADSGLTSFAAGAGTH